MTIEFVKVSSPERIYGETNLLQSEVALLTMLQQHQEYESLRKDELYMKIELKRMIGELHEHLDKLAKSLPISKFEQEMKDRSAMKQKMLSEIESQVKKAKKSEWRNWKERGEGKKNVQEIFGDHPAASAYEMKMREEKPKPVKIIVQEEPEKSPIERELEEIRKRLASLHS